jgi:hypothetical protein
MTISRVIVTTCYVFQRLVGFNVYSGLSDCTLSFNCVISLDLQFNIMPFVESSHNFRFELARTLRCLA